VRKGEPLGKYAGERQDAVRFVEIEGADQVASLVGDENPVGMAGDRGEKGAHLGVFQRAGAAQLRQGLGRYDACRAVVAVNRQHAAKPGRGLGRRVLRDRQRGKPAIRREGDPLRPQRQMRVVEIAAAPRPRLRPHDLDVAGRADAGEAEVAPVGREAQAVDRLGPFDDVDALPGKVAVRVDRVERHEEAIRHAFRDRQQGSVRRDGDVLGQADPRVGLVQQFEARRRRSRACGVKAVDPQVAAIKVDRGQVRAGKPSDAGAGRQPRPRADVIRPQPIGARLAQDGSFGCVRKDQLAHARLLRLTGSAARLRRPVAGHRRNLQPG
jgi:hypothetical protein